MMAMLCDKGGKIYQGNQWLPNWRKILSMCTMYEKM